jgi:CBS domain-containing protein/anti-sigma regulatory factor (Ser/Thr protein kinase)
VSLPSAETSRLQELTFELRVGQAMTPDPVTVTSRTSMARLRELLRDRRISGAPVVSKGRLTGIVTVEDLIKSLMEGKEKATVGSVMSREVSTLFADEPLSHALARFQAIGYGRLPVIDRGTGALVGMLTKGDILRCLLKKMEVDYREEELHRYRASHIFEDILADDIAVSFRYLVSGGDFQRAGSCSSRLRTSLLRLGIPPETVRRVAIATYEAEMNLVIYTPGGTLEARVDKERVRVRVLDRGPGIPDIEKALTPGFSTAPDWVRSMGFGAGMGLPNIKELADEMRLESKIGEFTDLEFGVCL